MKKLMFIFLLGVIADCKTAAPDVTCLPDPYEPRSNVTQLFAGRSVQGSVLRTSSEFRDYRDQQRAHEIEGLVDKDKWKEYGELWNDALAKLDIINDTILPEYKNRIVKAQTQDDAQNYSKLRGILLKQANRLTELMTQYQEEGDDRTSVDTKTKQLKEALQPLRTRIKAASNLGININ